MLVPYLLIIFFLYGNSFFSLIAYDHPGFKERYGQDLPSTSLDLMKEEREARDQESMKNIEEVVYRAVHQNDENKLQESKNQKQKKVAQEKKQAQKSVPEQEICQEVYDLLDHYYQDDALVEKKISVNLKKVELREALELIGKLTGLKFIMDADVEGTVKNFSFKDTSLSVVLRILLENNIPRLALLKDFGVWRIVRRSVACDILKSSAIQVRERDTELETFLIKYARWDDQFKTRLEKLWQGIVGEQGSKQGYYLIFDDYSKKLFFRARKKLVHDFKRCLQEIDVALPQIRIDARVVLAEKNFEEAIGFEWSGIYDRRASLRQNRLDFAGILGARKDDIGTNVDPAANIAKLLNWSLNFIPTVTNGFNIKFPLVFGDKNFNTRRLNLLLQAAENKNEIKTILKPSMLVKSDEMAEILVGSELPQEVRLSETVEGQPTNITTVSYKDVGMKIKVKPIISPDQQAVFLDIFVENSMLTKDQAYGTTGTTTSTFNYTIKTSRSRNRVLLKNGQTTLISGLLVNMKEKSKSGIPLLSEIPVLGWFFGGSRRATLDTQLLIFITPTLV